MDVLVLGGTSFVGRAIVDDLIAHGHTPSLFTRGKTGSDLFPSLDKRVGDRESGDYASLQGATWDAVVDVSAYVPRHVAQATAALNHQGRYLFISTGSVYDLKQAGETMSEDTPRSAPYRDSEEITGETYGRLKVACEDDALELFGDRATIVRPGIVAGPYDPTDRFTYWARRAPKGGRMAVPGRLDQPVQVVDSRDLARLTVALLEQDQPGTYNAVGPNPGVTLRGLIEACTAGADHELVEVTPIPGFPLLLPDASFDALFSRSAARALAMGMPSTPLSTTAADTRAWDAARGEPPLAVDLTPEREQELLSA